MLAMVVLVTGLGAAQTTDTTGIDTVMVASEANFPDALVAAGPAEKLGIPVLITEQDEVPDDTQQALETLSPREVVIVGGSSVVSNEVADTLDQDYQVTRYAGITQIGTSVALADAYWPTGAEEAVIVQYPMDGQTYWDEGYKLLTAVKNVVGDRPVLLSDAGELAAPTVEAVSRLGVSSVDIYATNASGVEADLSDVGVDSTTVIEGDIETLIRQVETEDLASNDHLVAVAASEYREALALPASEDATTMLVSDGGDVDSLVTRVQDAAVSRVTVVGTADISDRIVQRLENETETAVRTRGADPAEAAAARVSEDIETIRERQQQRKTDWEQGLDQGEGMEDAARRALNETQAAIDRMESVPDHIHQRFGIAESIFQDGEYREVQKMTATIRSYLQRERVEAAREQPEEREQLVQQERQSYRALRAELESAAADLNERLEDAESAEEKAAIMRRFRQQGDSIIDEYDDVDEETANELLQRYSQELEESMQDDDREVGDAEVKTGFRDGSIVVASRVLVPHQGYDYESDIEDRNGTMYITASFNEEDAVSAQQIEEMGYTTIARIDEGQTRAVIEIQLDDETVLERDVEIPDGAWREPEDDASTSRVRRVPLTVDGTREPDQALQFSSEHVEVETGTRLEISYRLRAGQRHGLAIEGKEAGLEPFSGDQTQQKRLSVVFDEQGEYTFYDPVGDNRDQGLEGTIVVRDSIERDRPEPDDERETTEPEDETSSGEESASQPARDPFDGAVTRLEPETTTIETGEQTTYRLVTNISAVGAFNSVMRLDAAVGRLVDATVTVDNDDADVLVEGDSLEMRAIGLSGDEEGMTELATVTVEGVGSGQTRLQHQTAVSTQQGATSRLENPGPQLTVE